MADRRRHTAVRRDITAKMAMPPSMKVARVADESFVFRNMVSLPDFPRCSAYASC